MDLRKPVLNAVSYAVGATVCRLQPLGGLKRRLLGTFTGGRRRGPIEEALFSATLRYWQEHEFLAEPDPDRRETMKEALMGGGHGARWAAHYDAQPLDFGAPVGSMTLGEASPVLPELDHRLANAPPAFVVQVGASSGRELAWLASRHPGHRFLGTDIYPEVVAYARDKHPLANLRFELIPARNLAAAFVGGPTVPFVFSSGSLQYVQPEHVQALFRDLARIPGLVVALQEPSTDLLGDPSQASSSRWNGNFSYAHPYAHFARAAGFPIAGCRLLRPYVPVERFPGQEHTLHYNLWTGPAPGV